MAEHETIGGAGAQPAPPEAATPDAQDAVVTEEAVADQAPAPKAPAAEDVPEAMGAPQAMDAPATQPAAQPATDATPHDHEAAVARDLDELTARAQRADEYLELAQRTKADFENYRRRAVRDAAAAQDRGVAKLAKELLPAVDNLDRALAAAESAGETDNGTATLVSGIKLVHADVIAALGRAGIEPFSPEGEPFDPQHHEAVAQQPVEGAQPGTVVEVYQRGYRLGDSVLRPARVVVAG